MSVKTVYQDIIMVMSFPSQENVISERPVFCSDIRWTKLAELYPNYFALPNAIVMILFDILRHNTCPKSATQNSCVGAYRKLGPDKFPG